MEKSGNIYIEEAESDFKKVHKSIILDKEIDCLTLGIYTKILVLGKAWQLNIKGLSSIFEISDTKIRRSISLLERKGYISRKPIQDEKTGKLSGWNYIFHAKPLDPEDRTSAGRKSDNSTVLPENRQHGYPTTRLSDNTENGEDNIYRLKEKNRHKNNYIDLNTHSSHAMECVESERKKGFSDFPSYDDSNNGGNPQGDPERKVAPKESAPKEAWRTDFSEYMKFVEEGAAALKADAKFRADVERLQPNVDYDRTIDNCVTKYWGTEAAWEYKRRSRTKKIDMKATLRQNFDKNRLYKENLRPGGFSRPERPGDVDTKHVDDDWADVLKAQRERIEAEERRRAMDNDGD